MTFDLIEVGEPAEGNLKAMLDLFHERGQNGVTSGEFLRLTHDADFRKTMKRLRDRGYQTERRDIPGQRQKLYFLTREP